MLEWLRQLLARPHVDTVGGDFVLTHDVVSVVAFAVIPAVALLIAIGCWRFARRLAERDTPDSQAPLKVRIVACGAFLFALVNAVVLIPGMMHLEVRISDDRLMQTTGFWWDETVREFPFDRIDSIREGTQPGQFGPEVVWFIAWRDGPDERFRPCDVIAENSDFVAAELRKRGVRFVP